MKDVHSGLWDQHSVLTTMHGEILLKTETYCSVPDISRLWTISNIC